jgi:hypothetical protein
MSKLKVLFIFCMVVLLAVVAVFPNLGNAGSFEGSKLNGASHATSIEVLIADGGDPQPPPRPMPWLGVAS